MRAFAEYDNYAVMTGLANVKQHLRTHWWYHRDDEMTKQEMLSRPRIFNQIFANGEWRNVSYCEFFVNQNGMLSFTQLKRLV